MNKCFIIGNLTADPESRTTQAGDRVVSFTVAVNQKRKNGPDTVDYFRVSAWRQLGDICAQYLSKGKKVNVIGTVHAGAYMNSQGKAIGTLELTADDVEFLSPRGEDDAESTYRQEERKAIQQEPQQGPMVRNHGGFVEVNDDDLPF